ncbi:hypothetical protein T4D_15744 [Trichinella pseudospiralis]|uniref:Uncharacterized protein n=1 Tax=Trichinella pseudospiralis TaxID=6337 RepID=A0A0V1FJ95_TRIPS|nr:hypothetical protein T4D_15744 [Trichinella pseudospiralis]
MDDSLPCVDVKISIPFRRVYTIYAVSCFFTNGRVNSSHSPFVKNMKVKQVNRNRFTKISIDNMKILKTLFNDLGQI